MVMFSFSYHFGLIKSRNMYLANFSTTGKMLLKVSFLERRTTSLNSEFSFSKTNCLTKAKEPNLPCYLNIASGRTDGVIPFPRELMWSETQTTSSRIWTQVTNSISYDNNHCIKE